MSPTVYAPGSSAIAMPAGAMTMWGGTTAVPPGWLLCNGQAVSRSTFSALFAAIGTTHGPGDGSTTFNLPNMIQSFPRGSSLANAGITGGSDTHDHGSASMYAQLRQSSADGQLGTNTITVPAYTTNTQGVVTSPAVSSNSRTNGVNVAGRTDMTDGKPAYTSFPFIIKW